MMAASAALPAFQSNHSPAGDASFADQVSGSAIYLDSVAKPLFCGESGYGNISSNSARATRRRETDAGSRSFSRRHQSFSEEIGHAAADTYLITRLTFKLLSYLGVGYRWITRLLALACYAMLLLPGFLQELMLLGFISLLLTVFQGAISKMCVPEKVVVTCFIVVAVKWMNRSTFLVL